MIAAVHMTGTSSGPRGWGSPLYRKKEIVADSTLRLVSTLVPRAGFLLLVLTSIFSPLVLHGFFFFFLKDITESEVI